MMIQVGKAYKVLGFSKECPESYLHRLLAFGFVPNAVFSVIRKAPLGNPFEIEIQGVNLSLRRSELDYVEVVEA